MRKWMPGSAVMAGMLALIAFGWTGRDRAVTEPTLETAAAASEDDCLVSGRCATATAGYLTHWVSRTGAGNLFLVMRTDCAGSAHCSAWFVERTARGVGMRLNIEGQFRVLNSGKPIPDVQTWRQISENETAYTRYSWIAGAFLKVETRSVYRVDGHECGTALECYEAAAAAHRQHMTDKALKIWEQVHNVSWI